MLLDWLVRVPEICFSLPYHSTEIRTHTTAETQTHTTVPDSYMGAEDPNLVTHAWTASILATGPSP